MIRMLHPVTGFSPFTTVNCADLGDSPVNPADVGDSLTRITDFYDRVVSAGITPMSAGGDHLVSLPILRSLRKRFGGPLAMIHFDSHTDLYDSYFGGFRYTHGTPFRRAIEEGLLDPTKIVQIGLRGTQYDGEDMAFARDVGVRTVMIEELMERGPAAVMAEARAIVGTAPTYCSFDIDFIDPAFAPGTGTPEIGGPTTFAAQQCVRGLEGVDLVGADLVEVSPPFDTSGGTAWVGVSMIFEILCPLAAAVRRRKPA
ncbi:Guanidinobutyrase [Methylobrevis pamukkalensis]|uniref:Guanidinobutyrase n=1 Tax=Methylobrevis pamukkalensis TaxID=1439726 RepID=A0A1E3GZD3_9HYPH|nr:Guanidinobutyrase [Methylobrevis pamukkalensis]